MKKIILILLMTFVSIFSYSEKFFVYGVNNYITQKYFGMFDMPQFEYMGGMFGDYVYRSIIISEDEKYYASGILSKSWFDEIVAEKGIFSAEILKYDNLKYDNLKFVSLSFCSVVLIEIDWQEYLKEKDIKR